MKTVYMMPRRNPVFCNNRDGTRRGCLYSMTYIIRKRTMEDHIICFNIKTQSKGRHKTKPNSLGSTCTTEVTRAERREIRESRGPNELGGGSLVLPRRSVDLFI